MATEKKTTTMMTRFKAAFKGLVNVVRESNRRNLINNILDANELANKSDLITLNEEKYTLVSKLATCKDTDIKLVIQELCTVIKKEQACEEAMKFSKIINDLLDEEIEVEVEK